MRIRLRLKEGSNTYKIPHIRTLRILTGMSLHRAKRIVDIFYDQYESGIGRNEQWKTYETMPSISSMEDIVSATNDSLNTYFDCEIVSTSNDNENPAMVLTDETRQISIEHFIEHYNGPIDIADTCMLLRKIIPHIVEIDDAPEVLQTLVLAYNASSKYVINHSE